ncbi:MAG: hypothetical protein WBC04_07250 [Candidatus Acidiferrales bacterium]
MTRRDGLPVATLPSAMPIPPRSLTKTKSFPRCYGSEFINWHLQSWCEQKKIQLTRGRPYKKDDNAHVEQKNWTHVRKLLGWDRYDSRVAVEAINDLYRHELRLWLNLYLPSVKLVKKMRVGSKVRRVYDPAQTPLERVLAGSQSNPAQVAELKKLRQSLDPFQLGKVIDHKLAHIYQLANRRLSPKGAPEGRGVQATKKVQGSRRNGCGKHGGGAALENASRFPVSHSRDGSGPPVTFQMSRRTTPGLHFQMA